MLFKDLFELFFLGMYFYFCGLLGCFVVSLGVFGGGGLVSFCCMVDKIIP